MKEKNGSIEQAMHGYSNGHRLLSSSQKFSDIDNKKMIILSDLSGNEFINGFEKYFTGYKLEDGRSVLACTWYAKEMSRPGCVWTHSLILNKISLSKENINYIFSIFRKPNIDDDFSFYSKSLHLQTSTEKFEVNNSKLKYIIWCVLKSKTPSVVFADSSILYEKELIYLFLAYNHILDSKFSFCTGAISLRTYENQIMQFQVVPYKLARSTWLMNNKVLTAKDENIIKEYPMWVNKIIEYIQIDNLKDISHFKSGFSTKYNQSKYFSSFVKLYVGTKADCKKLSLGNLLQLATAIFDDKEEICEEILQLYFQGYFYKWNEKEYISALQFFIENQWLYISRENIHDVVSKGFEYEYIKSKNLFKSIIRMEGNYIIEEILKTYAELLSYNQFVHFTDLEYESCSTLITLNPKYIVTKELWQTPNIGYQQGMIQCLDITRIDETLIRNSIQIILKVSEFDLSNNLYKVYGESCIKWLWEYILLNRQGIKAEGIKQILRMNHSYSIQVLREHIHDKNTILFLLTIIDAYKLEIKDISKEELNLLFLVVKSGDCTKDQDEVLARFLIPICITIECTLPIEIVKFSFNVVNNLLKNQNFPDEEWDKLEVLLPEVPWYNNWDKCKRLRKGFRHKGYSIKEIKEKDEIYMDSL